MHVSFLLALVPAVAFADVSAPTAAPARLEVGGFTVTVGLAADGKVHVRVVGGGELVLEPAGRGYVAPDQLRVEAHLASERTPAPLVKVSSRPEACSDFWDIYVSVVDGVPRNALELDGLADPPAMSSATVKFAGDDAVVTTRTEEDETHARTTRARYRWNGRVYERVSKRAGAQSK